MVVCLVRGRNVTCRARKVHTYLLYSDSGLFQQAYIEITKQQRTCGSLQFYFRRHFILRTMSEHKLYASFGALGSSSGFPLRRMTGVRGGTGFNSSLYYCFSSCAIRTNTRWSTNSIKSMDLFNHSISSRKSNTLFF